MAVCFVQGNWSFQPDRHESCVVQLDSLRSFFNTSKVSGFLLGTHKGKSCRDTDHHNLANKEDAPHHRWAQSYWMKVWLKVTTKVPLSRYNLWIFWWQWDLHWDLSMIAEAKEAEFVSSLIKWQALGFETNVLVWKCYWLSPKCHLQCYKDPYFKMIDKKGYLLKYWIALPWIALLNKILLALQS